jgi:cysteine desulfurase/selenocysteine lyase
MDIKKIRKDFPILSRWVNGRQLIYLANASTTQKPKSVINVMNEYYENHNANISSTNKLSSESKKIFERSREKIAEFIHASSEEIIFTKNASEALNLVAHALPMKKKDEVITTIMEHHSNIVPWQVLEKEKDIKLRFMNLFENSVDVDDLDSMLSKRTKLVTVNHLSNVLGTENNVHDIIKLSHDNDSLVMLDGCQSAARIPVDVKKIDCDFFAFSGHKMLGPQGIGCLYVKKGIMKKLKPFICGGSMKKVSESGFEFADDYTRFEPGLQNIAGAIGLTAAIDYLENIEMKYVEKHDEILTDYALKKMKEIEGVKIYSSGHGIIPFNVKQLQCFDVANLMSDEVIMISAGHHFCMPLMKRLDTDGVARFSSYVYNTKEEVDKFIERLERISALATKRMMR